MPKTIAKLPNSTYKDVLNMAEKENDTPFMSLFTSNDRDLCSFQGTKERTITRDQATDFLYASGLAPAEYG